MRSGAAMSVSKERNIVIIGNKGCGKSTVANHIMRKDLFPVTAGVSSLSRPESCICRKDLVEIGGDHFTVTIIEVNDARDLKNHNDTSRLDSSRCECSKITVYHLILFVVREGRDQNEYYQMLENHLSQLRPTISDISAIIITNCETKKESSRFDAVQCFHEGKMENISSKMAGKCILTVGFPDIKSAPIQLKENLEEKISQDERALHELIKYADRSCAKSAIFKKWYHGVFDMICFSCR